MLTSDLELRDRGEARGWLAAGLCLMRLGHVDAGELTLVGPWIVDTLSERGALPPVGVIADIGHLLAGRGLRGIRALPAIEARLSAAVRAYEDHLLGRLEASPRLDELIDAFAPLDERLRARAVALVTGRLLSRLGSGGLVALAPGVVRELAAAPFDETAHAGLEALTSDQVIVANLAAGYEALVAGARRTGNLIDDADVFLVANVAVLGDLTQRLAIEQMAEVAGELARGLPRRMKPRRSHVRRVSSALAEEDSYPAGGFSSISTTGSIENLVVSELIYMEEDAPERIDLFDLRYAEGELLYYLRDDSRHMRNRRAITFAIAPDLVEARVADPGIRWQRLVIALGAVACAIGRLADWLDSEAVAIRVAFVDDPVAGPVLAAERGLCELLCRAWIERGIVEVTTARDLAAEAALAIDRAGEGDSDLIVVTAGAAEIPLPTSVWSATLSLAGAAPRLRWRHRQERPPESADAWDGWQTAIRDLLTEMV